MKENIPVLLLKKLTLLPTQEVRIELNNNLSKKIIDLSSLEFNNKVLVILPENTLEESPTITDLPKVGILAYINSKIVLPNNNYRVVLKGLNRVKVNKYLNYQKDKSILLANAKMLYIDVAEDIETTALKKKLIAILNTYIKLNPEMDNSILNKISTASIDDLTDLVVSFLKFPKEKRIYYMNEFDANARAKSLIKELNVELEMLKLSAKIDYEIKEEFAKEQKEFIIKQKIAKLNAELGLSSSKEEEILNLRRKVSELNAPSKIKTKLLFEIQKYEYTPVNSPEISMIRNYIETLLSIPFASSKEEETDSKAILKVLNETHYGLEEIKERICEFGSLKALNPSLENPIICLVGAPGIGKTTIAKSIAAALKRDFAKISLGGLNDSSELTGHRRTYLGAAPGKIITSLIKCGSNNPVILLDEVDKLLKDYKGDPASTLLDILDTKQNKEFIDNYVEEPVNLSNCLFILTANDASLISPILKDRLEIINLPSYTIFEKKDIALNYLIPNINQKYHTKVTLKEDMILDVIKYYTLEFGVRELERKLDKIIRFKIINKPKTLVNLKTIFGPYLNQTYLKQNEIGEVNIIGVTPYGGTLLQVESAYKTETSLSITGNIGDKLKDAIYLCLAYLETKNLIDFKKKGLHINFTGSNIKLDGTSGCTGILTSILSLTNNVKISESIAFLGNIDLYGNILKISKLKEKLITAYNQNIKTVYLPKQNEEDTESLPSFILKEINLIYIENYEEIIKLFFKKK